MSTTLTAGALAVAALALTAPAATADAPFFDCGSHVVPVPGPGTATTYEGVIEGFVVHAWDFDATIRCFVTVDGVEVATTPTAVGVVAGQVSYTVHDSWNVVLCAEATVHHDSSPRTLEVCPQT